MASTLPLPWWLGSKRIHLPMQEIPGAGRSPGEGDGNPLLYSSLGNLMDKGAWQVSVLGVAKNQTQLNTHACTLQKSS